jgi:hypothetical protein
LRDVLLPDQGNADRTRRFRDQLADDGRLFQMERAARRRDLKCDARGFRAASTTHRGLLQAEAEKVWWKWNPAIWGVIRYRGCFGAPRNGCEHRHAISLRLGFMRRMMIQYRNRHAI